MNEWLKETTCSKKIRAMWERWKKPFIRMYMYSLIIYIPLIVLRLTNDMDGMWDQDDHLAGVAELRVGRWFWPYLDRLRFGISLDPLPALVSLFIFVCGVLCLLDLFLTKEQKEAEEIKLTLTGYITGILILSTPAVLCQLSYSYMSITFAVSFLLSVVAVRVIAICCTEEPVTPFGENTGEHRKKELLRLKGRGPGWILLSALLIALMMGCYQASLGVTCIAALVYFMVLLSGGEDFIRSAFRFVLKMLLALVIGAMLYEVLLYAHLWAFQQTLSDYNGADSISLGQILANLPSNIKHCYTSFKFYFFQSSYKFNAFEGTKWFYILYIMPVIGGILYAGKLWKKEKGLLRIILLALSVLIIPVFANSFFILATESDTMMQMTGGMSIGIPLILLLWDHISVPVKEEKGKYASTALSMTFALGSLGLIYGAIGQIEIDQYAMYVGRQGTTTLAENVLNEFANYGVDYDYNVVLVYGSPAQSETFVVGDLYWKANPYAQYGNNWSQSEERNRLCWNYFFKQQMRVSLNYAEGDTLHTIYTSAEVEAMTTYPHSGCVSNVWGVTVVKVSE